MLTYTTELMKTCYHWFIQQTAEMDLEKTIQFAKDMEPTYQFSITYDSNTQRLQPRTYSTPQYMEEIVLLGSVSPPVFASELIPNSTYTDARQVCAIEYIWRVMYLEEDKNPPEVETDPHKPVVKIPDVAVLPSLASTKSERIRARCPEGMDPKEFKRLRAIRAQGRFKAKKSLVATDDARLLRIQKEVIELEGELAVIQSQYRAKIRGLLDQLVGLSDRDV